MSRCEVQDCAAASIVKTDTVGFGDHYWRCRHASVHQILVDAQPEIVDHAHRGGGRGMGGSDYGNSHDEALSVMWQVHVFVIKC